MKSSSQQSVIVGIQTYPKMLQEHYLCKCRTFLYVIIKNTDFQDFGFSIYWTIHLLNGISFLWFSIFRLLFKWLHWWYVYIHQTYNTTCIISTSQHQPATTGTNTHSAVSQGSTNTPYRVQKPPISSTPVAPAIVSQIIQQFIQSQNEPPLLSFSFFNETACWKRKFSKHGKSLYIYFFPWVSFTFLQNLKLLVEFSSISIWFQQHLSKLWYFLNSNL